MESAAELHEARVLRGRIEMREAEMAALPGDVPPADRARLAEEIARLKGDYRRVRGGQVGEDSWRRPHGRPSLRRFQRLRLTLRSYDFFQISNVTILVLASLYWCVFILSETLFVSSPLPLLSVRVWSASAYGFPSAPPGISIV